MIKSLGFKALFENASIGIIVINSSGKIVLANHFLLKQFGYTAAEIIGKDLELLIPERFRTNHTYHRKTFFKHPQNRPMGIGLDLYAITKEGREFPVEVSLTHLASEEEVFAAAYINDISVRKASELALANLNTELESKVKERTQELTDTIKKLNEQIKEVEAKDLRLQKVNGYLNNILNHAGAMISAVNEKGIIELFNPAAEACLGYKAEEVVGKYTHEIFHDPEEIKINAAALSEELKMPIAPGFEAFVAKARLGISCEQEWTYIRKDGSRFPVMINVTALRDQDNNINGFLRIAIDISDQKKAETELRSALRKERDLGELKSKFVSIASHEFRTPLSTILSSVYLISQYQKSEEQDRRNKHIQRIVSSVNMLTDILNDFLSVGKIEDGKIQVRPKDFKIQEHFQQVIAELKSICKEGQFITYEHTGADMLHSDPAMLKHIFINLLTNAVKFSPEHMPIEIRTTKNDSTFSLSIKDHGIGIPEEDQQHLFELFFRAGNADHIQGTGLGLHIIKRYTELLHGDITCHSVEGHGTEFKIVLREEPLTSANYIL